MKFETRREHAMRLKRQRRSGIIGLVLAFALVIVIGIAMYTNKVSLDKQYAQNEQTKAGLQVQIEEQQQRTKDVLSYALFPQVATDFFKYREAQQKKVDATVADTKNGAYPV